MNDIFDNYDNINKENVLSEENVISEGQVITEEKSDTLKKERSPIDLWIEKYPRVRKNEVEFLKSFCSENQISISGNGKLLKPFKIETSLICWTFLMEFDKNFPNFSEKGDFPIRVYLVQPNFEELKNNYCFTNDTYLKKSSDGLEYINFESVSNLKKEIGDYISGYETEPFSKKLLEETNSWLKKVELTLKVHVKTSEPRARNPLTNFKSRKEPESFSDYTVRRSKYTEGRRTANGIVNDKCKKIVLSDRAYSQICSETYSRLRTETGGLLLGHYDKGVWYVIEASDPGLNATFTVAYHEGDDKYENHVCGVLSKIYKYPLVFLGMWHRHPGSLDSFSGTDDQTNYKYAESAGNGCISALVNIDPDLRITFYYVEQGRYEGCVYYTKVDVEIGDDKFENREILKLASKRDLLMRTKEWS